MHINSKRKVVVQASYKSSNLKLYLLLVCLCYWPWTSNCLLDRYISNHDYLSGRMFCASCTNALNLKKIQTFSVKCIAYIFAVKLRQFVMRKFSPSCSISKIMNVLIKLFIPRCINILLILLRFVYFFSLRYITTK